LIITHLGVLSIRVIDIRGVEVIVLILGAEIVVQKVGHLVRDDWRVSLRNVEPIKRILKA
jgi:hypothetical protein